MKPIKVCPCLAELSVTSFELIGHCFSLGYTESDLVFRSSECQHGCFCWWTWSFTGHDCSLRWHHGKDLDHIQCQECWIHPETEISYLFHLHRQLPTVGFIFRHNFSESGLSFRYKVLFSEVTSHLAMGSLISNIQPPVMASSTWLVVWMRPPTSSGWVTKWSLMPRIRQDGYFNV